MLTTRISRYGIGAALAISFTALLFLGLSGGITGVTQKNGNGCTCHAPSPTSGVTVRISGPDSLTVGQTATFRLTIKGGPLNAGGTNIAARTGTLDVIVGQGLQLDGGELTHTQPKTPVGDSVSFQFSYTAPASPGSDTLYANGNSVNLTGNNSGDQWNFAPRKAIRIKSLTSVADVGVPGKFSLEQNYPNPFNPSTTIQYSLPSAAHVRLEVFDLAGRQVGTLVNGQQAGGTQTVTWSPANLPSGTYFYTIVGGGFRETRKALYVK